MNLIEMRSYYDIPLHCPFCGVAATKLEGDEFVVNGCNHLQLISSGDFVIHMSERFENLIKEAGYLVAREEYDVQVENPLDEDDWPNLVELCSKMSDVVIFEQIVGPPSLEASHTVFAYNDEDYAKFGDPF